MRHYSKNFYKIYKIVFLPSEKMKQQAQKNLFSFKTVFANLHNKKSSVILSCIRHLQLKKAIC